MTHEQFTQIYLPLCGKMYALAYTLLRNRNAARDCVQDVYAELWENRDSIEPDQTHVLKMVHDKCLARTGNNIERLCDTSISDAPHGRCRSSRMPPTRTASPCRRTSATALRLGVSKTPWRQTTQALSHSYLATE